MIEFTLSRVSLCVCGVILIASVTGTLNGIYDSEKDAMDEVLADRFAYMLDLFQSSEDDTLILDGSRILPEGYSVSVHDGLVELFGDDGRKVSATRYQGSFNLVWNGILEITRRTSPRSSSRCP